MNRLSLLLLKHSRGFENRVAAAITEIEKPTSAVFVEGIRCLFEQEPEREWRDHIEAVAFERFDRFKERRGRMSEIVVVLLSANLILLLFLIFRARPKTSGDSSQALTLLQNQMGSLSQAMADGAARMQDSMRIQQGQLADAAGRMQEGMRQQHGEALRLANEIRSAVDRQLTEVAREVSATKESTQQVFQLAEQLQNLERVLKHQKQRGNLGERSLELILSNMLPPGAYRMQHELAGGETVDAVIMAREGLIPIDAKFPLDNYVRLLEETDEVRRVEHERAFRNDLKLRIDETAKYVRPETLPFALMFVPAEGIYYDLLINDVGAKASARNLVDYAMNEKRVMIVSPTTFAAYLHSILYGFKAFQVEEAAKEIARNVDNLVRHLNAFEDFHRRLGAALSTTVDHYNASAREFGKIDKDVLRITGERMGTELETVERPQADAP